MSTEIVKSKGKSKTVKSKVDNSKTTFEDTKLQVMLNRKTFFEQALINLNNNPFRIVLL